MAWWRLFRDRRTGRPVPPEASGPRRREHERFAVHTKVVAKCSSWPRFLELVTGDVSAGGLFIPTEAPSRLGEKIEIDVALPGGQRLAMTGTVVNIVDAAQAAGTGRRPGLGVKLDPPPPALRPRFHELLAHALAQRPVPPAPAGGPDAPARAPKPPAMPRGHADPIIGIDLGTTHVSVAAAIDRQVTLLPWPDGQSSSPSAIHFPERGEARIGAAARALLATDPLHTIASPRRLLGGAPDVEVRGEPVPITRILSLILAGARQAAERALGTSVGRCVMTCPVSFDAERSRLLRAAAELAGLEVVQLLDEPSAAALANRFDQRFGGTVGIYDFGGGTFDFSAVDVSRGDFVVLGTAGDTWLGGDDLDHALAEIVAGMVRQQHQVELRDQEVDWRRLLQACEQAKRRLSEAETAEVHLTGALPTAAGLIDLRCQVDRPTFERACATLVDRTLAACDQALEVLEMKPGQLQTVYLSGGTAHVPAVRRAVAAHLQVPVHAGVPPEQAVCLGAAIHAARLQLHAGDIRLVASEG